jgi:NAD(P)-dependent dehydrogenase (short-subunit alcohol dehydrogenase family)
MFFRGDKLMSPLTPHACITGGAKRVGRGIALHLARAGYDVTVHYRHSKADALSLQQEIRTLGKRCRLVQADLADGIAAAGLLRAAEMVEPMPPLTLLVHNASLFARDTLADVTPEQMAAHLSVNLTAPVLLTQAFAAQLPSTMQGQVIALTDGMHGWSVSPTFLSYSLSKLALEQFVRLAKTTLAPQIRINALALGATLEGHMDDTETFEKTRRFVPLQHNSCVEEVCAAIMALEYLPSVTGEIVHLSGGIH